MGLISGPQSGESNNGSVHVGPLVDDGAEYSAIGSIELQILLNIDSDVGLEPPPDTLNGHSHWQYGQGEHRSARRPILGSIVLPLKEDNRRIINIRHVVVQGSSQCIIGRNFTSLW